MPTDALFGPSPKQLQQQANHLTSPQGGFVGQQPGMYQNAQFNQSYNAMNNGPNVNQFDPFGVSRQQNAAANMNPNIPMQGQPPLDKNQVLAKAWDNLNPDQKRKWDTLTEQQKQQWSEIQIKKYLGAMGMMGHTQPSYGWGHSQMAPQQQQQQVSPGWPGSQYHQGQPGMVGQQPMQLQQPQMQGIPRGGNPAAYQMRPTFGQQ